MAASEPLTVRGLYVEATRLRDFADSLELRAEGDPEAFTDTHVLGLHRTATRIQDLLGVLDALGSAQRTVIPFPTTERTPR